MAISKLNNTKIVRVNHVKAYIVYYNQKIKSYRRLNLKRGQHLSMRKSSLIIKKRRMIQNLTKIIGMIGLILTVVAGLYLWHAGLLTNQALLRQTIHEFGVWAPLAFIGVQIIQVVIPVIPGGVTLAVGPMLFGTWLGFIYNYIGIVLGSLILFRIGRVFGLPLVEAIVSKKIRHKYMNRLNSNGWEKLFIFLMILPIAPDDALVLLTSLTKMSFKQFFWILILSKPVGIACYSFIVLYSFDWLIKLIGM